MLRVLRQHQEAVAASAPWALLAIGLLLVLLLVEGWGMEPAAAGVVVTAMPLAAIASGGATIAPRATATAHGLSNGDELLVFSGWEDLNDHGALRCDVAVQTAVGVDHEIASAPTLCRLEKWADRATAWRLHEVLVNQFIASFESAPEELVLDFDATDNPLHGQQEARFFHGYYDSYCYLPLYVFCGQQLLCAYLRPSNIDAAQHAGAILKLLVRRLRQSWPQVRIVFRADSGFCRQRILNWCERAGVHYIVGLARNARLQARVAVLDPDPPVYGTTSGAGGHLALMLGMARNCLSSST
mgnify:CR=1 FL=1